MSAPRQRSRDGDEAGISLVEVIIYSALTALLLSVLGGMFYTGFQTQAAAGSRDAATGAAQVVSNTLQTGVRNASSIVVSDAGTKLTARVATGAAGWQCAVWKLTPDKKLVYKTSSAPITATDYSTWPVLATGANGPVGGGPAFASGSTQLTYSLAFASGDITPVRVAGTITASALGAGSPASC